MLVQLYTVNLQLQNVAHERDERKGASNDFTSQFLFIDLSSKDERATRILRELTLTEWFQ